MPNKRNTFGKVNYRAPDWADRVRELERLRKIARAKGRYIGPTGKKMPPGYVHNPKLARSTNYAYERKYNMSLDAVARLHRNQDGRCANVGCRVPLNLLGRTRAIDHDHKTGKVRGMLCKSCNVCLGLVHDDPRRLIGLVAYLGFLDPKLLK